MPTRKKIKTSKTKSSEQDSETTSSSVQEATLVGGDLNGGICALCIIRDACPLFTPFEYTSEMFPSDRIKQIDGARRAYLILRTPHVMAFLDVNPLVRGRVLVCLVKHTRPGFGVLERTVGLDSRSAAEVNKSATSKSYSSTELMQVAWPVRFAEPSFAHSITACCKH